MSPTQLKTLIPGVTLRTGKEGRSIRFSCMVNGTRFTTTYKDLPVDVMVDYRGRPTRELRDAYDSWRTSKENELGVVGKSCLRAPSLLEMVTAWKDFATKRSLDPRYLKPSQRTIATAVKNFRYCWEEAGLDENDSYRNLVNEDTLRDVFDKFIERNLSGVSAWSYLMSVQTLTSPWTQPYYEKLGYLVRKARMPDAGLAKNAPRYFRPSQEMIDRQDLFYASLQDLDDKRPFLVATMAIQFAMRPNDIGRLKSDNFIKGADGCIYLSYVPNKTKMSSGRRVTWKVPDAVWGAIRAYAGDRLDAGKTMIQSVRYICDYKLNPAMRKACNMEDSNKGVYEFRKRCIDYVYHHFGINAAVAISGDRAETIQYYYFDPSMTTMAPTFMTVPIQPVSSEPEEEEKHGQSVA